MLHPILDNLTSAVARNADVQKYLESMNIVGNDYYFFKFKPKSTRKRFKSESKHNYTRSSADADKHARRV